MAKNVITVLHRAVWALLLCSSSLFGQNLTGSSLSVTGTGTGTVNTLVSGTTTINLLEVTGAADFQTNTWSFGVSGTNPGISITYSDGSGGSNSSFILTATHPLSSWVWQRMTTSGNAAVAMQLDTSNCLILTGTAASNPSRLVLDPNEGISVNGSTLITQGVADSRYLSSGAGINVYAGNVGVGTTTPSASLEVAGNVKIGPHPSTVEDAILTIGNGSETHPANALTVSTTGQVKLYDPSDPATPALILDPVATGTSVFPGTVVILPHGDIAMGQYIVGSGTNNAVPYTQVFPNGIHVSGSSSLGGITVVSGTFDLSEAAVLGVVGNPGPAGPQGPVGATGAVGPQGPAGPAGAAFTTGPLYGILKGDGAGNITTATSGVPSALTKASVGLGDADNTSDANKPISSAQAAALANKEPALGNPTANGQVLVSTTTGVRSWAAAGGSGVPAGAVMSFATSSAPSGWLKCNGAAVSRATYAELFSAIGTAFGAGDGSTTFNLPDLRGEFVRGWDEGRGADPGRGFATYQGCGIQSHNHYVFSQSGVSGPNYSPGFVAA